MLDDTDRSILKQLMKNGRITMKELGEKVHLTGQAASSRVLKLEQEGVIKGYTVKTDMNKTGFAVHCFITVYTKELNHQPYLTFINSRQDFVINNYKISGDGCYILECKFPTNQELDQFLTSLSNCVNYKVSIVISR